MISTRLLRPLAIGAFALGLLTASPASAHFATGVAVGAGTISPGLPTTGCANQTVSFTGTAVLVGNHVGPYDFSFTGTSSICETLSAGAGCGTISGPGISGQVCYSRTANFVQVTGTVDVDGVPHTVNATCVFNATSVNPVQTYHLVCQVTVQ